MMIVALLNSSGLVWTENIWCVFRVKLSQRSVDNALKFVHDSMELRITHD